SLNTLLTRSPRHHPHLHSFPTRRSSDLTPRIGPLNAGVGNEVTNHQGRLLHRVGQRARGSRSRHRELLERGTRDRIERPIALRRSEEHTSELQSRGHLVCRLLLEKKKTK